MEIILTSLAKKDIRREINYAKEKFGVSTARKVFQDIEYRFDLIAQYSEIGIIFKNNIRVLKGKTNAVFYKIEEKRIIILTVFNNKKNALLLDNLK